MLCHKLVKYLNSDIIVSFMTKYDEKGVAAEVCELIERETCIRRLLSSGLINVRALARHLKSKSPILREASLDAVISAIRRMPQQPFPGEKTMRAMAALKTNLRNRVVILTLANTESVQRTIPDFISSLKLDAGEILRLAQGADSIKMIIDEHNLERALKEFGKSVTETAKGMAEIEMTHPPEATKTPGVVAAIAMELALNGINVAGIFTCSPGVMFIVKEEDAPKAYEILCRLPGGK